MVEFKKKEVILKKFAITFDKRAALVESVKSDNKNSGRGVKRVEKKVFTLQLTCFDIRNVIKVNFGILPIEIGRTSGEAVL